MDTNKATETLKFSREYLAVVENTDAGIGRVAGHTNRAYGAFKKAVTQPFLLTPEAAKRVLEVEHALECLRVALDAAHVQLQGDAGFYKARIEAAEAVLKLNTVAHRCDCEAERCHPHADCKGVGEVKTIYSVVCKECAAKMPAEYLVNDKDKQ